MSSGNATVRVTAWAAVVAAIVATSAVASAQVQRQQNFDSDPGWIGTNNVVGTNGSNDFGFKNTNDAGGSPGELGGQIKRSGNPVSQVGVNSSSYGDDIGALGYNNAMSFSGKINNIQRINDGQGGGGYYIGWYKQGTVGHRLIPVFGFRFDDNDVYINANGQNGATDESSRIGVLSSNTVYDFSFVYNPAAGSFGQITVNITGFPQLVHNLRDSVRLSTTSFDRFGIHSVDLEDGDTQRFAYDNLNYTAIPEPTALGLIGAGLAAVGMRRRRA